MAIVKAPLKTDPPGKCSRWRVILYNPVTHKQEWATVRGGKREAQAYEEELRRKVRAGTHVAKPKRKTFAEVADLFLQYTEARGKRPATLLQYRSLLRLYLLPAFGHREVGTIRAPDVLELLQELAAAGKSRRVSAKIIATGKAVYNFAIYKQQCAEVNPFARMEALGGAPTRAVHRGAFTESELQTIFAAAEPQDRALFMATVLCGLRPQEAFGLAWRHLDLTAGTLRVERVWDSAAQAFGPTKSKHGERVMELSAPLIAEFEAHRRRVPHAPDDLVFATAAGTALDGDNVRKRRWYPTLERAGVRRLDFYSPRHTFASMLRNENVSAFVAARLLGHGQSDLVDRVYAHVLPSATKGTGERVSDRVFGKLQVIDGGKTEDLRHIRQTLENGVAERGGSAASR
jgi:integrase